MALSARMPDLGTLELLVAVDRAGSIGAAARAAGLSQQAASERLRTLEALVGVAVLRRTPRGSVTTAAGALLVEWATGLLAEAAELDAAIATLRSDQARQATVAASMTVAEHLLPRWLVRFAQRHPAGSPAAATISLIATNSELALAAVRAGTADLGFVEGIGTPSDVRSRAVGTDDLVLVVAPAHPWARRRRPVTAAELARTPLTLRESGSGTREVVEAAVSAQGLELVAPAVELTTSTAVREAVLAGSAPALISGRAVASDLASGRLAAVPTQGLALTRTLRAIWTGGARPSGGAARELLDIALRDGRS